jgi:NADP-dependent 3-hydroxy acid dehydrogenase YdfG
MTLKGEWILITGASSGFGAAAAVAFARAGANLILGARRIDRLEKVAQACRDLGSSAHSHFLDVASSQSVITFASWASEITSGVHVLINNAGGAHGLDPVATGKDSDWEAMVQSNFLGLLRVTRAILPLLKHHSGSSIINIGSIAGHTAYAGGPSIAGSSQLNVALLRLFALSSAEPVSGCALSIPVWRSANSPLFVLKAMKSAHLLSTKAWNR